MPGNPLIDVVEAVYRPSASMEEWLMRVALAIRPLIDLDHSGVIAYHVDVERAAIDAFVQHEVLVDVAALAREASRERAFAEAFARSALEQPTMVLVSEYVAPEHRQMAMLSDRVVDALNLRAVQPDRSGVTVLGSACLTPHVISDGERQRLLRLSAHIQAGWRIRGKLAALQTRVEPGEGEAVLDPRGRIVHATGDATEPAAREKLLHALDAMERARDRGGETDERALEIWRGLVDGTWSLVDALDSDQRRYVVACRNEPGVIDPRGLTPAEARAAAYAGLGYSNKLIAYTLGLDASTVAHQLESARQKLGFGSRIALVAAFAQLAP